MVYLPCRFPTVGGFESPLAQIAFKQACDARMQGNHAAAKRLKAQARSLQFAFRSATRVKFSC